MANTVFKMNHSTELAAIELVDRILKYIDNKKLPLAIYGFIQSIWYFNIRHSSKLFPKLYDRQNSVCWSK